MKAIEVHKFLVDFYWEYHIRANQYLDILPKNWWCFLSWCPHHCMRFFRQKVIVLLNNKIWDKFKIFCKSIRNGNGAGSGRVAPIPTPPRLLKIIPIPVPFKKLNGAGRVFLGTRPVAIPKVYAPNLPIDNIFFIVRIN